MSFLNSALAAKRLELLNQIVPNATIIAAILQNPVSSGIEAERRDLLAAGQAIGQQLVVLDVSSDREIETAFTTLIQRGAKAVFVGTGAFMNSQRERIVALAARHGIPATYNWREVVAAGGLMSYGASITDAYRQAGDLRRTDPQGREAGRSAGDAADQVRAGDQPQDREGARPQSPANAARASPTR